MSISSTLNRFFKSLRSSERLRQFFGSVRFRLILMSELTLMIVLLAFSALVYYRQVVYQRSLVENRVARQANYIFETYKNWYDTNHGQDGLMLSDVFPELQGNNLPTTPGLNNQTASSRQVKPDQPLIQSDEVLLMLTQDGQVIGQVGSLDETDMAKLVRLAVDSRTGGSFRFSAMPPEARLQGVEYMFLQSVEPLVTWTNVSASSPKEIILLMGAPFDPYGQLPGLAWSLALASVIIMAASLLGSYWLAGRILEPVQSITKTAQEIGAHDLTKRLNLNKQDELGELADTFDQMLDRLETAFRQQRQFTTDASHDLRTPLTIVNLEVNSILQDPHTGPELYEPLESIRDENEHMIHLVNNLLVLARADAEEIQMKPQTTDLSEITLDAIEKLIPLAQRNGMQIHTSEMPPVMVRGDRTYLGQMVTNLVENAIKYGNGEEKMIWIETGTREKNDNQEGKILHQGWLRVEDHGPGIAEEHLPHLFDRFYRADPSRPAAPEKDGSGNGDHTTPPEGHGLGLSIVQWIAREHGGDARVSSQVGKGTVFEVVLPLAEDDPGKADTR